MHFKILQYSIYLSLTRVCEFLGFCTKKKLVLLFKGSYFSNHLVLGISVESCVCTGHLRRNLVSTDYLQEKGYHKLLVFLSMQFMRISVHTSKFDCSTYVGLEYFYCSHCHSRPIFLKEKVIFKPGNVNIFLLRTAFFNLSSNYISLLFHSDFTLLIYSYIYIFQWVFLCCIFLYDELLLIYTKVDSFNKFQRILLTLSSQKISVLVPDLFMCLFLDHAYLLPCFIT